MGDLIVRAPDGQAVKPHSDAFANYLSPEARGMVLHDADDLAVAVNIINDIKSRVAALEEARVTVTQPINAGLRAFNAFFAPAKAAAQAAREVWDTKIRLYEQARAAERRAAEAALAEAVTAQDQPAAAVAIMALVPAPKQVGVTLIDTWDFEERNHDIVPTALTLLNPAAVRAEIKRQLAEGVAEPAIPGLRVTRTQIVKATG